MAGEKILVVDDETYIVELVKFNLEKEGYEVDLAYDGISALENVSRENPDLIILDIMLPNINGLQVCRKLKQDPSFKVIPIIMLTARGEEMDTIVGLESGADDYIKKPFSPRELVARVNARLRAVKIQQNNHNKGSHVFHFEGLRIDHEAHEIYLEDERLELTPKEFELISLLTAYQGKVFNREELLEKVWGYECLGDTRTVDVHIRHLRRKLHDDSSNPKYIETVRGVGYRFVNINENFNI
ncbi:MAG: response regulator transcription factor [Bacillota bacterium]|nr:response regulator transcription factor [Bacillota bacterium]